MPRGGKRSGKPGTAYSNRSDLTQAPSAAPGQTYGTATAQLQAQKVAPLPQQAGPPPPAAGSAPGVAQAPGAAPAGPMPGALGPLNRPTERPGEPLTAGLPFGPGPGPEVLGQGQMQPIDEIRALYAASPNIDMLRLLQFLDGH